MPEVITNNLDLWTSALLAKSTSGRGSNGKQEAYGNKKLRELILELAVRGKLVPQDPNDEPASVLLKRIVKEKRRLTQEGKIKKEKSITDIGDDEKTFELPQGWEWVRFGSIAQHNSGKTLDSGRNAGQLRDYITTSNLYWGRFDLVNIRQMPIVDDELEKCTVRKGDLLICEGGEAGRAAVWPFDHDVCFQNHVHRARFYGEIDPYFAYRFFEKLNASGEIDQHRKGVGISNMSSKALTIIVVPLPPLAEQHRIVAKVDELMALCDQLEQQQTDSIEAHQTLVKTFLGTLTSVASHKEFALAWTRIADHFDTLFTTEQSIDQLKQTILQLAVMGNLVPQDPNDEPAAESLKQIEKLKTNDGSASTGRDWVGGISAPVQEVFIAPAGWAWTRIANTVERVTVGYVGPMKDQYVEGGVPFLRSQNVRANFFSEDGLISISPAFHKTISKSALAPNDVVVVRSGNVGTSCVIPPSLPEANCSDLVVVKKPLAVLPTYLCFYLNSIATVHIQAGTVGVALTHFNTKSVATMPLPLPPLAEQHRIVAKVDELMALCDALKARLAAAQATQIHLADAIVEQAVV